MSDLKLGLTFKKVRSVAQADDGSIKTTLFRDDRGRVCGWYIGPLQLTSTGIGIAYLPPCDRTLASVAVVRAVEAAKASNASVCIVDPDDLWEPAWRTEP